MEKVNDILDGKLQKEITKSAKIEKDLESHVVSDKELHEKSTKCLSENLSLKTEIKDLKREFKDKSDIVVILEHTVDSKLSEITKLKEELDNIRKNQFQCIFCEFKTESDEELRKHVRQLHDEKCNLCDLAFESRKKLKEHICKIHIRNPTHGNCFMKNWILDNGCTPIYNKMMKNLFLC